jgi:cytochrome P450
MSQNFNIGQMQMDGEPEDCKSCLTTSLRIAGFGAFAKGLIAIAGDTWYRHRRTAQQAFHPNNLRVVSAALRPYHHMR